MLRRKNRPISIAGAEIVVSPMPAREGLECVVALSEILSEVVPYLSVMADPSRKVRTMALLQMVAEHGGRLPDVLLEVVAKGTGISQDILEHHANTKEVLVTLGRIIEVNKWQEFWLAAQSLQLTDERSVVSWFWLQLGRLRTRMS